MQMQLEATRHPGEAQSTAIEPDAAKLSEAESFPSALAAESREPDFPAARLQATEESLECVVQSLQRPALQVRWQLAHVGQFVPALCQRLGLVDVISRLAG